MEMAAAQQAAMEAALPEVSTRGGELCRWAGLLVDGSRALVTAGRDVSGLSTLGDGWREARAGLTRGWGEARPWIGRVGPDRRLDDARLASLQRSPGVRESGVSVAGCR